MWSDPSSTVCCMVTDSPVLVVCTLASMAVRYPDCLESSVECRVLDMWIRWRMTSFAVGDATVDAMVWQIWHEPLVNLSWHCKTGSTFFGELHQLGFQWYCVSSLSLMILHTIFTAFCCTSASAYTRTKWQLTWLWHVWYFICYDTLSQSQYHGNIFKYDLLNIGA